jgi:hypothetical protein
VCQGDILKELLALPGDITIAGVSVIHPLCITTLPVTAATEADARRDQQKRAAYARIEPNVYPFVPFSIESFVRLGPPAMKPLHELGYEASGPLGDERASFVAGVLQCIARAGCTQTKMVVVIIS